MFKILDLHYGIMVINENHSKYILTSFDDRKTMWWRQVFFMYKFLLKGTYNMYK